MKKNRVFVSIGGVIALAACGKGAEDGKVSLKSRLPTFEDGRVDASLLENLPAVPSWPDWIDLRQVPEETKTALVCHGMMRGRLVVSRYSGGWLRTSWLRLGDYYFAGGFPLNTEFTACYEVEEGTTISYSELQQRPFARLSNLYMEGVFSSEDVSKIFREDLAWRAEKEGEAWKNGFLTSWQESVSYPNGLTATRNNYRNHDVVSALEAKSFSLELPEDIRQANKELRGNDGKPIPITDDFSKCLYFGEHQGFRYFTSLADQKPSFSNEPYEAITDYLVGKDETYEGYVSDGRIMNLSKSFSRRYYFGEHPNNIYAFKDGVTHTLQGAYGLGAVSLDWINEVALQIYSYKLSKSDDKAAFMAEYVKRWNENYKNADPVFYVS